MQFTIADPEPVSEFEVFAWMMFWAALLVGVPLLRWLMRSPRDGRDVLGSASVSPRSFSQGLQDLMGWACLAVLFTAPLLLGMAFVIQMESQFFEPIAATLGGSVPSALVDVPFTWGLFAAMTVLGALLRAGWLRRNPSERDVLHVRAHAP
ncbi:hypothetical protein G4177_18400 [Corallococcus sp. ZKHCc1 1396]|uniref:MotA/TolQ/ExbB proton channel domain-containing protein n=1 Tax=Corallococcus soli TaxID=2710757 RepID=A0ABR9PQE6_9BACT|nr:hypothetical protein [Corallococcus soli]MBE4750140.1 hypothetical protein [Corallococcus soli]